MISKLDQSHFVRTHADIDSIIQPLKDFFGITSFVYQKSFLNGSEIRLSNQPAWVSYFYEKKLYNCSLFEHTPSQYVKGHVLWSSLPEHGHVLNLAREFNIDHGITFIEPQADGIEFFFLGTTPDRHDIPLRYLNHIDLLEKFIAYFKKKAAHLINTATQSPIIIADKLVKNVPPAPLNNIRLDRDRFIQQVIQVDSMRFSAREYDCIKWFKQGYSLKMIANELNISPRTVETHFEHIKQKAQCHTRSELVKYLARMG